MLILIIAAIVVFFAVVCAAVVRGSAGLLKKRLHEDPELAPHVAPDDLEAVPTGIEY